MKKILFVTLLVCTALYSFDNLKILNPDEEGSDTLEIGIKGNGESCRLWFASSGSIDKGSCIHLVNSQGVRIYCTPKKKMCKTYDEIYAFVFSPPTRGNTAIDDKGYSRQYKQCLDNSGGVTVAMRRCNGDELKFQDRRLNRYYKKAMNVLDKEHRTKLKKVQRLWIKYRDAKCGFLFGLTGGTMDLVAGGGCYVDMTTKRAQELNDIADSL